MLYLWDLEATGLILVDSIVRPRLLLVVSHSSVHVYTISLDRGRGMRIIYPCKLNKGFSLDCPDWYTSYEGRRIQRRKLCDNKKMRTIVWIIIVWIIIVLVPEIQTEVLYLISFYLVLLKEFLWYRKSSEVIHTISPIENK